MRNSFIIKVGAGSVRFIFTWQWNGMGWDRSNGCRTLPLDPETVGGRKEEEGKERPGVQL